MDKFVSQAAYARHSGVSGARVSQWKRQGQLVMKGEFVDVKASDVLRAARPKVYRGGEKGGSRSRAAKMQDAAAAVANGNGHQGLPESAPQGMAASVAMKEFYLSKLREIEYDEKLGTLVDVEAVTEEVAAVFSTVRNLFLGLPAKLAPRVIHCETAEAARSLIQAEVETILRELSAEPDEDEE